MRSTESEPGITAGHDINHLHYADATVLVTDSSQKPESLLNKVIAESAKELFHFLFSHRLSLRREVLLFIYFLIDYQWQHRNGKGLSTARKQCMGESKQLRFQLATYSWML